MLKHVASTLLCSTLILAPLSSSVAQEKKPPVIPYGTANIMYWHCNQYGAVDAIVIQSNEGFGGAIKWDNRNICGVNNRT